MNLNLQIILAFMAGVVVMTLFEYPALNTAWNGLQDKNAAIERLEKFCNQPGDGK